MRLLVLTHSLDDPSFRLRWGQLFPMLEGEGIECSAAAIPARGKTAVLAAAAEADVTVHHRRLLGRRDYAVLRRAAKRLIYDIDDALCYRPLAPHRSRQRERRFFRAAGGADAVFAGNRVLAGISRIANRRVMVVPTTLLPDHYGYEGPKLERFTAVWIGQRSTVPLLDPILRSLRDAGIPLRVIADTAPDGTEFVPWSLEAEARALGEAHVGVMPIPNNPIARGKCGFKLLQYFAAGLPAVASPVGVNRSLAAGGALLARTPAEWVAALTTLRDDAELRDRMGAAAFAFVSRRYNAEHLAQRVARLLKT